MYWIAQSICKLITNFYFGLPALFVFQTASARNGNVEQFVVFMVLARLGIGERQWWIQGRGPGPPLFWVKNEEMTEGRKASRASKFPPPPSASLSLSSGSATERFQETPNSTTQIFGKQPSQRRFAAFIVVLISELSYLFHYLLSNNYMYD